MKKMKQLYKFQFLKIKNTLLIIILIKTMLIMDNKTNNIVSFIIINHCFFSKLINTL